MSSLLWSGSIGGLSQEEWQLCYGLRSEVVVAVTKGRFGFGTWERIFSGQTE